MNPHPVAYEAQPPRHGRPGDPLTMYRLWRIIVAWACGGDRIAGIADEQGIPRPHLDRLMRRMHVGVGMRRLPLPSPPRPTNEVETLQAIIARAHPQHSRLTRRQRDVLRLLALGFAVADVGRILGITPDQADRIRERAHERLERADIDGDLTYTLAHLSTVQP